VQIKPTRSGQIDEKWIHVFDNLVSSVVLKQINDALDQSSFTRNEIAKPETQEHKHWAREMPIQATQQLPLFRPTMLASGTFCAPGTRFNLYRSYTNYASFGDMLFTHTDCMPGAGEITALWFIAEHWEHEWGGETLFFNQHMDAEFVVSPKPGRLILFNGEIPHVGRPPNRICYTPRYTFAMKFEPIKT